MLTTTQTSFAASTLFEDERRALHGARAAAASTLAADSTPSRQASARPDHARGDRRGRAANPRCRRPRQPQHAPCRGGARHRCRIALPSCRQQGRAARPPLRPGHRRAGGPRRRPRTLARAAERGRAHDARHDPPPPRHRPDLDRTHPDGPQCIALLGAGAGDPPRRRHPRPARGTRTPPADLDRQRLHPRRDRRGRPAAR